MTGTIPDANGARFAGGRNFDLIINDRSVIEEGSEREFVIDRPFEPW
jgi:hypothetical protein